MSSPDETVYPTGQHYSGRNRIPNIKQFVEGLDRDKKRRDAKIDKDLAEKEEQQQLTSTSGSAIDHIPTAKSGRNRRTIRDPVTGKDVEIEDIGREHVKVAENRTFPLFFSPYPHEC
jgi:hypothetical protein